MAEKTETNSSSMGIGMKICVSGIRSKFPTVQDITTQKLSALMQSSTDSTGQATTESQQLIILDARPEEEYGVGHIDGSVRVDYDAASDDLISKLPQLHETASSPITVVSYCSVGYRSSIVTHKLQNFFKKEGQNSDNMKFYNLEGSIFKWANEGRPMVDGNGQSTTCTHPYNSVFGKLLNSKLRKSAM